MNDRLRLMRTKWEQMFITNEDFLDSFYMKSAGPFTFGAQVDLQ